MFFLLSDVAAAQGGRVLPGLRFVVCSVSFLRRCGRGGAYVYSLVHVHVLLVVVVVFVDVGVIDLGAHYFRIEIYAIIQVVIVLEVCGGVASGGTSRNMAALCASHLLQRCNVP